MSDHSKIEWTDATWNPLRGCTKISPGCKHCYAETFAERFRGVKGHPYEQGFDLKLVPDKLTEPFEWPGARTVFVNSMSDLFQPEVPDGYIEEVVRVMVDANWHTYQVLTKRSERLRDLLSTKLHFAADQRHIWWGVSVEDRRYGMPRIEHLRSAPAAVKFLSIEPLLEDLGHFDISGIDWAIVGGESGHGARLMERGWVERILRLCDEQDVAFFFKQWGGVRKSKTGRALNGRTYDEMPERNVATMPARRDRLLAASKTKDRVTCCNPSSLWPSIPWPSVRKRRGMSEDNREVEKQARLFEFPYGEKIVLTEPAVIVPQNPVWTDNKAQLIMRYLRYFAFITKHGTYLDGFAGPQEECETDSWAAKLVLESEPRWIRHVHLCDQKRSQVKLLEALKARQPERDADGKRINRDIHVYQGDFNAKVDEMLAAGDITEKEATFCLLDQRTFECDWQTVEKLARFKKSGHKIELFYFLANGWLERALSGQKDLDKLARWWGRDDWTELRAMSRDERRDALVDRMKSEFGYKSVKAWPIFERDSGGAVMYYMIHATDHPEGPIQMSRAYRHAVLPLEPVEQLKLEFIGQIKGPEAQPSAPFDAKLTA